MSDVAIRVENLSKQYRIGLREPYKALRDVLTDAVIAPFRRLSSLVGTSLGRSKLRAISNEYIWALKDVSFEVKQGDVVGVIGRNGAGKSTLLKILSRITRPTKGYAEIHGRVGSLLEVGTGFHPELTGRENIYLNGAILGMKRAEIDRKFDEIVAFAEIEKFMDTPVKRYSSGMYVRLAFAVAAHLEPEILLVDEVLAVGDAAFQKKCLGKMGAVSRGGRTILFVSHNMTAVKSLCTRAILLDKGQIVESGEVDHVVSNYLQSSTLSLMEQVWNDPVIAPGNDQVRLHFARITPLNQDPGEFITVETALQLEFEFWNCLPGAVLNFTFHLFTVEGVYVLAVASDIKPRHGGLVRGVVQIPSNFLNEGLYSAGIMIVKDASVSLYYHPDVIVFEVHDSERAGSWFGKWPGVVRPQLKWITEDII